MRAKKTTCCGLGEVYNFPSYIWPPEDRAEECEKQLLTSLKNAKSRSSVTCVIATLITGQKTVVEPILIKHGFTPIKEFRNRNTGNMVFVYWKDLYTPEELAKLLAADFQ